MADWTLVIFSSFTKMSSYQNVLLPKCPFTEMSFYRNVLLPKCQLPKCPLPKCPLPKRHGPHNYTRLNHAFCARYVIKSETAALITDRHYVNCSGTVYGYDISCHMLFLSATDCNEQARTVVAAYNNKIIIYLLVILLIC